ncbi:MAG: NAD(P)-binding domain-containing protein [Candidatus Dormibacteraceae bacterium]
MKIGIVGSGNVGKALARAAVKAGHEVTLSASSPEHAAEAAKATGTQSAGTNADAVKDAELVILAVPASKVHEVVDSLGSALDGKVLMDTTNRVDPQHPDQVLDGSSVAEQIQERAPRAIVVKALNYMFAARMDAPSVSGIKLDGFVVADNQMAKDKVLEFVKSIGLRPIDAGPLVMSRALEGMALLIIMLQISQGWPWQNGWKLIGPPE